MDVCNTIYQQLGGNRFRAMTGVHHLTGDGNTLRMQIPRNRSKANRLEITYNYSPDDYTMRFYWYTPERLNHKTMTFSYPKTKEVKTFEGVYFDMLQDIFTDVTGMHTHL